VFGKTGIKTMMNAAFPRGRRPREEPEPEQKDGFKRKRDAPVVEKDFLFGDDKSSNSSKKKKKSDPSSSSFALPLGGGHVVHSKKDATIEALSFKKLAKGTKLLGIVREVNDDFCLISLPSLLTGYVLPKKDVSVHFCNTMLCCSTVVLTCHHSRIKLLFPINYPSVNYWLSTS
jgi:hypothetical protein